MLKISAVYLDKHKSFIPNKNIKCKVENTLKGSLDPITFNFRKNSSYGREILLDV